jgi:hypothetical protein
MCSSLLILLLFSAPDEGIGAEEITVALSLARLAADRPRACRETGGAYFNQKYAVSAL